MIPEREFASAEEMAAHYKAVRSRLGLVPKAPVVVRQAPLPPVEAPKRPQRIRVPKDDADAQRSVGSIIERVAAVCEVTPEVILSYDRSPKARAARGAAIAAVYKAKKCSLPWLAKQFRRNHATIFWWLQKAGLKPPTVKGQPRDRTPQRLTPDQQLAACELYRSGLTCQQIAERYAVSSGCICRVLNRHGVAMRQRGRTLLTPDQALTICDLYRSGLGARKIAKQYGVSFGCIWYLLRRYGVAMRPKSRPTLTPDQQIIVCEFYQLGLSTRQVAELFGLTRWPIVVILTRHGIALRPAAMPRKIQFQSEARHVA